MNPLERAAKLHAEADEVIELLRLRVILSTYGEITFVGSYFLDLMVYPDIDISIPKISIDDMFRIGAWFARCERVPQVIFERSNDPLTRDGLYIKPRVDYGNWGRPWKVDIWSLDDNIIQARKAPMLRWQQQLTPETREHILRYKLSVMTAQHRTPMGSGFHIYRAVLDEGLRDFAAISRFLLANGIQL